MPDDVRDLAVPVLSHRIILASRIELLGKTKTEVLADLVGAVPVPVEEDLILPEEPVTHD